MNIFLFIILLLAVLVTLELIYFKIATRYNIIDHPNHRSSHTTITIRGGGIIFSIALLISPFLTGLHYIYFITGLLLISIISFIDDLKTINNGIRISFHLISVSLLFYQLNVYNLPYWLIASAFFIVVGTINAVNFMDGINGITGSYGLVALATFFYINKFLINFTSQELLIVAIVAVLVFNFFNFRIKAKCFAGDVGSVSLAFIIIFFLLQLITKTNNFNYILILLMYGLDTATTILFRVIKREKISEAHRSHFYQYLANEKKVPHIVVASGYAITQALINLLFINFLPQSVFLVFYFISTAVIIFVGVRFLTEGKNRLLKSITHSLN